MYEALSDGMTFLDPDAIRRLQICQHALWWLTQEGEFAPEVDASDVIDGDYNGWLSRIFIGIRWPQNDREAEKLRNSRRKVFGEIADLFKEWQIGGKKKLSQRLIEEARGFGYRVVEDVDAYVRRMMALQLGFAQGEEADAFPHPSAVLARTIQDTFRRHSVPREALWPKAKEYLQSAHLEDVPTLRISAALFGAIAEQAAGGRKNPPNQGTATDINVISTLLPYCDAMFVDNEFESFLQDKRIRELIKCDTKVFCYKSRDAFLGYLKGIQDSATENHICLVREVYGENWEKPYTSMYERSQ